MKVSTVRSDESCVDHRSSTLQGTPSVRWSRQEQGGETATCTSVVLELGPVAIDEAR